MAILTYDQAVAREPSLADHPTALIQALLDASEEWIIVYLGTGAPTYDEPTAISELITARGELIMLSRPASEILSVKERGITLDAEDYELRAGGRIVRRLLTGTWPYVRGWYGGIDITYVPLSNAASQEVAQLALVKLELDSNPGVVSERIGEWSETFSQGKDDYLTTRAAILAGINPTTVGIY